MNDICLQTCAFQSASAAANSLALDQREIHFNDDA